MKILERFNKVFVIVFFSLGYYGLKAGFKKEKNKFKNYFDENNRLNGLLDLLRYLISQTLSPIQKKVINSIAIYKLLKIERPPLFYGCVLEYLNKLKLSPSPTSSFDFPLVAKYSWDEM
jgi:hypothetical protein